MNKSEKNTQSQANLATMATLSPNQTNVINFGDNEEILDMKLNQVRRLKNQQEQNMGLMKNRLNHIQIQNQQYQKNISRTQGEIETIVKTRTRVYVDQTRKQWLQEQREYIMNSQAHRVSQQKSDRMKRNQNVELSRQIYSDGYKQLNYEYKVNHSLQKCQLQNDIYGENRRSHKLIRSAHLQHQQEKIRQQQNQLDICQQNYQSKLFKEGQAVRKTTQLISAMEVDESKLLAKLRMTQTRERSISAKKDEIIRLPLDCFTPTPKKNLFRITSP